jgi:hypothetical protein
MTKCAMTSAIRSVEIEIVPSKHGVNEQCENHVSGGGLGVGVLPGPCSLSCGWCLWEIVLQLGESCHSRALSLIHERQACKHSASLMGISLCPKFEIGDAARLMLCSGMMDLPHRADAATHDRPHGGARLLPKR